MRNFLFFLTCIVLFTCLVSCQFVGAEVDVAKQGPEHNTEQSSKDEDESKISETQWKAAFNYLINSYINFDSTNNTNQNIIARSESDFETVISYSGFKLIQHKTNESDTSWIITPQWYFLGTYVDEVNANIDFFIRKDSEGNWVSAAYWYVADSDDLNGWSDNAGNGYYLDTEVSHDIYELFINIFTSIKDAYSVAKAGLDGKYSVSVSFEATKTGTQEKETFNFDCVVDFNSDYKVSYISLGGESWDFSYLEKYEFEVPKL